MASRKLYYITVIAASSMTCIETAALLMNENTSCDAVIYYWIV